MTGSIVSSRGTFAKILDRSRLSNCFLSPRRSRVVDGEEKDVAGKVVVVFKAGVVVVDCLVVVGVDIVIGPVVITLETMFVAWLSASVLLKIEAVLEAKFSKRFLIISIWFSRNTRGGIEGTMFDFGFSAIGFDLGDKLSDCLV